MMYKCPKCSYRSHSKVLVEAHCKNEHYTQNTSIIDDSTSDIIFSTIDYSYSSSSDSFSGGGASGDY